MWVPKLINNKIFLIKLQCQESNFIVSFTDFINIWQSTFKENEMIQICQELNPLLDAEDSVLKDTIVTLFNKDDNSEFHPFVLDDSVQLDVCKQIYSVAFKMVFKLEKCEAEVLSKELIIPMALKIIDLGKMQKELCDVIKKKDTELKEHNRNGHVVENEYLRTRVFDDSEFRKNVMNNELNGIFDGGGQFIDAFIEKYRAECSSIDEESANRLDTLSSKYKKPNPILKSKLKRCKKFVPMKK